MARLRVAILTMPGGGFVVHHLVKQLDVVGIVSDIGPWVKKPERKTPLELLERHWLRGGVRGAARAIVNKVIDLDHLRDAATLEAQHLQRLDARLAGGTGLVSSRVDWKQFPTLEEISSFHRVPLVAVTNINNSDAERTLRGWEPDLGIICGGRIIKPHIIAIPRHGLLNKHSSILPRHRGLSAEYWCLYYEDFEHLGVTVHFVEPGLDNGNILVQRRLTFNKGDTPATLRFKSELIGREAIVDAVRLVEERGERGTPQDESQATRNKAPTLASDRELYRKLPTLWQRYGA